MANPWSLLIPAEHDRLLKDARASGDRGWHRHTQILMTASFLLAGGVLLFGKPWLPWERALSATLFLLPLFGVLGARLLYIGGLSVDPSAPGASGSVKLAAVLSFLSTVSFGFALVAAVLLVFV